MRPIFTPHAGEYLVGTYLEEHLRDCRVWLPSKDTGIDLLVTDKEHRKAVSLQVKYSKDFMNPEFKAIGWWTLKSDKILTSLAELWVFALYSFHQKHAHYVILPPKDLLRILQSLQGQKESFQMYICVSSSGRCWEGRGLSQGEKQLIATDGYENPARELTEYLDNWGPLQARLRA